MKPGTSPRVTSSRKRIVYKPSGWHLHQFEIWSGELICKAAALRVDGALMLWLGGAGAAELSEIAFGVPPLPVDLESDSGGERSASALATTLLGAAGASASAALARRLATALMRPVYVCSGLVFDRFTMPLVERGLIAEIKNRPQCF